MGKSGKVKKVDQTKGMRPNVIQRRPQGSKPSPAKPFSLYRSQGK